MSDGQEQSGEKSHDPTPQRLEEARKRGDVAKSNDLSAAAAYLGLALALGAFGLAAAQSTGAGLSAFLARADTLAPRLFEMGAGGLSLRLVGESAAGLAPLFLAPFALVVVAILAQNALVVAPEKLAPKLSRISPIEQAKSKFGLTGLVEFAKSATKLIVISIVFVIFIAGEIDRIVGFTRAPPDAVPAEMGRLLLSLLLHIFVIAAVIAAIDFVWQRHDHMRKLRMTHQEVREEVKRAEGDPMVKSQRRRRGQEIVNNRMMLDVPKASVVIVNPTHYAVALKWSRKDKGAPVVVAKGVDEVARRIREAAEAAKVPVHSDPPTARALHAAVDIGAEIAPQHYKAAAAAIRFAEAMRVKARAAGR